MITRTSLGEFACTAAALLAGLGGAGTVLGQQKDEVKADAASPPELQPVIPGESPASSVEQGRTQITDAFDFDRRQWRIQKRKDALRDTTFKFNVRSYYLDRQKFDGSVSQAFTVGGWAGLKTGYFLDHVAFGATGYTSQKVTGDPSQDGTLLLKPGQESYSVLGELYADIKITDEMNLYAGRKEFDTPYINRNDVRMTPNTFEAIVLQGRTTLEEKVSALKYGVGYFSKIKERNSDDFVSMAVDAGAHVDRGVATAGALYEYGKFSIGGIDYYSSDIINIGYAEAKLEVPLGGEGKLRLATQFSQQHSVGDNFLTGSSFSARQIGFKVELPVEQALFSAAYTKTAGGANMQAPWSGYPGYTSVQVQDFNRSGEEAFLLRAGYDFAQVKGLSAYALGVFGMAPKDAGQFQQNEYDLNLQWAPPKGFLKGLSLRLRYALVTQDGGNVQDLKDFRVIANYAFKF